MCDMTHSRVWHDSFLRVTWLIRIPDSLGTPREPRVGLLTLLYVMHYSARHITRVPYIHVCNDYMYDDVGDIALCVALFPLPYARTVLYVIHYTACHITYVHVYDDYVYDE